MQTFLMVSLQDLLMHLALEEGCLKAGQRYWACFALRQVVSRLSAESMHELLTSHSNGRHHHIEDGAVLLVTFLQLKSMKMMARNCYLMQMPPFQNQQGMVLSCTWHLTLCSCARMVMQRHKELL